MDDSNKNNPTPEPAKSTEDQKAETEESRMKATEPQDGPVDPWWQDLEPLDDSIDMTRNEE
mgnify:CR=1|tara:strand:- start:3144 stop:3326 length:183 start_codon:yes stop_codon:yes gene_type:complete